MTADLYVPIIAGILFLVGFVLNMVGTTGSTTAFVLNFVGDLLMLVGEVLFLLVTVPPSGYANVQWAFKGDWFVFWIGVFAIGFLVGLVMNMFGSVRITAPPAAPATAPDTHAWANFVGDGLMIVFAALLTLSVVPPEQAGKYQTWLKTPAAASSTTSSTTTTATTADPQNPKYVGDTVTVDNDPPAGMELAVYWKGGSTPPEGAPFNAGSVGGWRFGPVRSAKIGTGATEVKVRFQSPDGSKLSAVVNAK
jgi:hypothetical protein